MKQYVCERCGYTGPLYKVRGLQGLLGALGCGIPCGALLGFLFAGLSIAIWEPLKWSVGIIVFLFIAYMFFSIFSGGHMRIDRNCPACTKGTLH